MSTMLLLGTLFLLADPPPAAPTPPLSKARVDQVLLETENYLRPAPADRWMLLAAELDARGLASAAKELRARIPTRALVIELLALGQPGPARELATRWHAESPTTAEPLFFEGIAHFAEGAPELALRALDAMPTNTEGPLEPARQVLHDLARFQILRGKPADADNNPWNVPLSTRPLPETSKAELPNETSAGLLELTKLLPTNPSLWGLLGSVLAHEGLASPARACFARARGLGYTPRWLLEQDRVLAAAEKARQQNLDAELTKPQTPGTTEPPGWRNLIDRPRELAVVIGGGIFAILIALLQMRQWLRKTTKGPRRDSNN